MERGVVVGGLMICGSFLLAALLNRSAMEEVPVPPAAPVAVVPPVVAPASQVEMDPSAADCAEADAREDMQPAVTQTEQPAPDCSDSD